MTRIIPDLMLSALALVAMSVSSGCYTQLEMSEEDETSTTEIIIFYPLPPPCPPPPKPCCPEDRIDYPASVQPVKGESERRDFGLQRPDGREEGSDRRKGGSGGRNR